MTEENLVRSVLRSWWTGETTGNESGPEAPVDEIQARAELLALLQDERAVEAELVIFLQFDPAKGYERWKTNQVGGKKWSFRRIAPGWWIAAIGLPVAVYTAYAIWSHGRPTVIPRVDCNCTPVAIVYDTLTSPRAGQRQVKLPDGSRVWLNNSSWLRYPVPFSDKARLVELKGEAYFEVAAEAGRSFVVQTKRQTVKVLATKFDVKAYEDEEVVKTTVIEGRVMVGTTNGMMVVDAGEQFRLDTVNNTVVKEHVEDTDAISWKDGTLYFGNATFAEAMHQISRWYDIDVIYTGKIPDVKFRVEMHSNLPLKELLKVFEMYHIHCRLDGRRLYIQGN